MEVFRGGSERKHVDQATSDTSGYVNSAGEKEREEEREEAARRE